MAIEAFGKSYSEEEIRRQLKLKQIQLESDYQKNLIQIKSRGFGKTHSMVKEITQVQDAYRLQMYHYQQLMAKIESDMDKVLGIPKPLETHRFEWLDMSTSKEIMPIKEAEERFDVGKGILEQMQQEAHAQTYTELTEKHLKEVMEDLSKTMKKYPMTFDEGGIVPSSSPSPILGVDFNDLDEVALEHLYRGISNEIDLPDEEKEYMLKSISNEQTNRNLGAKTRRDKRKRGPLITLEEAGDEKFVIDAKTLEDLKSFGEENEKRFLFGDRKKREYVASHDPIEPGGGGDDIVIYTGTRGRDEINKAIEQQFLSSKGLDLKSKREMFHMEPAPKGDEGGVVQSSTPVVPNLGGSLRQLTPVQWFEKFFKKEDSDNRYEL